MSYRGALLRKWSNLPNLTQSLSSIQAISVLSHHLKSLTIYQQVLSFLLLCKISCHYGSFTHSKSTPKKSNLDYKKKYPHVPEDTLEPIRIEDILTKNSQRFRRRVRLTMHGIKFGKEVRTIIVVDISLNSSILYF